MEPVIERLLNSEEPSIQWRTRVNLLGENLNSSSMKKRREKIKSSIRVRKLLSERKKDGTIPYHPYAKWYGAHWILPILADMGYPRGDKSLIPLREQIYKWLLSDAHKKSVKILNGRPRRCGSQEGNALYALYTLGLDDSRTEEIARFLLTCQWPDGGWNCDKNPEATHSSFNESILPLRGLFLYAKSTGNSEARKAVKKVADMFLQRKLFKRKTDNSIIDKRFMKFHYPCYWHYDILCGLKVMMETGFLKDKRCKEALDYLESRRLTDGGFPMDEKFYNHNSSRVAQFSLVDWGSASKIKMNEWVTIDALSILQSAGRFKV